MNHIKIFGFRVNNLMFYFLSCSFIGWCIEAGYLYFTRGRFVFTGLLHCPFSPIYGFGGLLLILLLKPIKHNVILFYLGAVLLTSILEYVTGFLIKLTLNKMLWDYSHEFLSINGYICLKSSLVWGLLSINFIYLLKPVLRCLIYHIPRYLRIVLAYSVFVFFLLKAYTFIWSVNIGFLGF